MFVLSREFSLADEWSDGKNEKAVELVMRNFMDEVGDYAVKRLQQEVPVGRTSGLFNSIHKGDVRKLPSGIYTIEVGITPVEGSSFPDYPKAVNFGTGRGNLRRDPATGRLGGSQGRIYPAHGNILAFQKEGEGWVYTRWTKGQKENDFMARSATQTNNYIRTHKKILAQEIKAVI